MINIVTGKPGSGKTYVLVYKALDYLKKGIPVYSNILLKTANPNYHYFEKISDIIGVKNGIIIIDEAQIYLNARNWEILPEVVQYKLQQHRKHSLHIWGSVQNLSRLDVVMRELVGRYYEVFKIGSSEAEDGTLPKRVWGLIFMVEYLPEEYKLKRRKWLSIKVFPLKKSICDMYDTLKDLGLQQRDDLVNVKMRICPTCGAKKVLYGTIEK